MSNAPAFGSKRSSVRHIMIWAFQQNAFLFSGTCPVVAVSGEQPSGAHNSDHCKGKKMRLGTQAHSFRAGILTF
jgi:hypothetical protein